MLSVSYQVNAVKKLNAVFGGNGKKVRQQVAIAINEAIKDVKRESSKRVRKELAVSAAAVNRVLDTGKRANQSHLNAVYTFGGNAIVADITSAEAFDSPQHDGGRVMLSVTYRTSEVNPFV